MTVAVLGIDLAKRVFRLHDIDPHRRAVVSWRVNRGKLVETVVQPFFEQYSHERPRRKNMSAGLLHRLHSTICKLLKEKETIRLGLLIDEIE